MLLAISLIVQGSSTVGQLAELLAKLGQDAASDGTLDDQGLRDQLLSNAMSLNLLQVRRNLERRLSDLGVLATVPDFEPYVDRFVDTGAINIVLDGAVSLSSAKRVHVADGRAYVVQNQWWEQQFPPTTSQFAIVDVSDPTAPAIVSQTVLEAGEGTDSPGYAVGVFATSGHAYVARSYFGFDIFDISTPTAVALVSRFQLPGDGINMRVFVANDVAWIAAGWNGLVAVNVANPATPTFRGATPVGWRAWAEDVVIRGSYAYIVDPYYYDNYTDGTLQVVDVSDPSVPTPVGRIGGMTNPWAVDVAGTYAYVVDETLGLLVYDIGISEAPALAGFLALGGHSYGVAVLDQLVLVANTTLGLVVVRITNPSRPALVGSYATGAAAYGVTVVGQQIYVADSDGLKILHLEESPH
jgi:hypothetical protein